MTEILPRGLEEHSTGVVGFSISGGVPTAWDGFVRDAELARPQAGKRHTGSDSVKFRSKSFYSGESSSKLSTKTSAERDASKLACRSQREPGSRYETDPKLFMRRAKRQNSITCELDGNRSQNANRFQERPKFLCVWRFTHHGDDTECLLYFCNIGQLSAHNDDDCLRRYPAYQRNQFPAGFMKETQIDERNSDVIPAYQGFSPLSCICVCRFKVMGRQAINEKLGIVRIILDDEDAARIKFRTRFAFAKHPNNPVKRRVKPYRAHGVVFLGALLIPNKLNTTCSMARYSGRNSLVITERTPEISSMLTTNEVALFSPAVKSQLVEMLVTFLTFALPILIALWRRAASNSKLQTAIIDAMVRGIEKSSDKIGDRDTVFVKKAVQQEAVKAGVEQHVEKVVEKVTTKMDEEKTNGKNGD